MKGLLSHTPPLLFPLLLILKRALNNLFIYRFLEQLNGEFYTYLKFTHGSFETHWLQIFDPKLLIWNLVVRTPKIIICNYKLKEANMNKSVSFSFLFLDKIGHKISCFGTLYLNWRNLEINWISVLQNRFFLFVKYYEFSSPVVKN